MSITRLASPKTQSFHAFFGVFYIYGQGTMSVSKLCWTKIETKNIEERAYCISSSSYGISTVSTRVANIA